MQGTRVGEARLSWVLVFTLSSKLQQEVFASGAPPRTTGRDQDTQRLKIKGGSSSEGSCGPSAFAVSRDTHSGLESLKAAAAKLRSPNMEHTGPQPQPSGSLGTV